MVGQRRVGSLNPGHCVQPNPVRGQAAFEALPATRIRSVPGNPTFGIALNSSSEKGRVMIIGQPQISRPRFLFVTVPLMAGLGLVGCANGGAGEEANGANEEAAAEGETDAGSPDEDEAEGPEGAAAPDEDSDPAAQQAVVATAELADADGNTLGHVDFTPVDGDIEVSVTTENMEPGFYGFHLHEIAECEPDSEAPDDPEDTGDFLSAGGHIVGEDDADHPDHAGDLPVLLVKEDGTATMSVVTDRVDEQMLTDDDGAAVIVHADEDNYGNVPERYLDPEGEPDEDTAATGDAGPRLACGVVEGDR